MKKSSLLIQQKAQDVRFKYILRLRGHAGQHLSHRVLTVLCVCVSLSAIRLSLLLIVRLFEYLLFQVISENDSDYRMQFLSLEKMLHAVPVEEWKEMEPYDIRIRQKGVTCILVYFVSSQY